MEALLNLAYRLKPFIFTKNIHCNIAINTFRNEEIYGFTTDLAIFNVLLFDVR